jgi:hypothetical protein
MGQKLGWSDLAEDVGAVLETGEAADRTNDLEFLEFGFG